MQKKKNSIPKGKKGGKAQKEFYTHIGNVKNKMRIKKQK